jgi:hypothetical protein
MNRLHAIAPWLVMLTGPVSAASPWPAEANTQARKIQIGQVFNVPNMSGACWNSATRTFWVCCNSPGAFWALVEDGAGGWKIRSNGGQQAKWSTGGDMEAICQPDETQPIVYLLDEDGYIRQYNVSVNGVINQPRTWDIRSFAGPSSGSGPEAITFVPDEWLVREGFRDASGAPRTSSNGMGGLMFVGHQVGGYVHVFDLNPDNNTFSYYGKLLTSRPETADITFDRVTGKLYIWHNTGSNYLEVAELNSTIVGAERKFRTLIEYLGPRTGNLEGVAPVFNPTGDDWILMTDDDNNPAGEALNLYKHLVLNEDTDTDALPDDWELRYFGTTTLITSTTANSTDTDGDGHTDLQEFSAGTDPTKALSKLRITSISVSGNDTTIFWNTVGGRGNIVQSAGSPTGGFSDLSPVLSIPGSGEVTTSYTHLGGGTGSVRFYRVRSAP